MNAEDWKNRCDSYKELSTRLQSKLKKAEELLENTVLSMMEANRMSLEDQDRADKAEARVKELEQQLHIYNLTRK